MFAAKKSVDSVVAVFSKAIVDLQQVAEQETAEAARQQQRADEAVAAKLASEAEAKRARSIVGKLESLVK